MGQIHEEKERQLSREVEDLDEATGGEGNKTKNQKVGEKKGKEISSYITEQPLKPLTKKFTLDR
ncbi:MAG: hypothetical protein V4543_07680 [Bacteroidota bacterium]